MITNINNNNDNKKVSFLNFLAPLPLKVIYQHYNTTETFGFSGMFLKIIFSHFLFYFEQSPIDDCSFFSIF